MHHYLIIIIPRTRSIVSKLMHSPPFNILAFLILKPASWIVSPRALHPLNVLLINKLTCFPILLVIGIYERYLAHMVEPYENLAEGQHIHYPTACHVKKIYQ
ncbi:hypothetical protein FB446DRAFT_714626 [Lentinula raphanica]|nr:hypothetical protein FB446DRAFT_714626 [Lentinula raphanica]